MDYSCLLNRWRCIISYCEYLREHFFYIFFCFYMFEWYSLLCIVTMGTSIDGHKPFWLPALFFCANKKKLFHPVASASCQFTTYGEDPLTYKVLPTPQSAYPYNLISYHQPSRSLPSSNQSRSQGKNRFWTSRFLLCCSTNLEPYTSVPDKTHTTIT